jgi:hypothetical protein
MMDYFTLLGTQQEGAWTSCFYDIGYPFGYDTMLSLFDKFISSYKVRVYCIAKATLYGQSHTVIWKRSLFRRAKPLSEILALKEECGVVAIGVETKELDSIRLYISLINQTSRLTIQIPTNQLSEKRQKQIEDIARFFSEQYLHPNGNQE